jgi:hypothetical protein
MTNLVRRKEKRVQKFEYHSIVGRVEPKRVQELAPRVLPVFFRPRHDLDEVAGAMAAVALPFENAVPAVPYDSREPGHLPKPVMGIVARSSS